jgi:hypothetical protein
MKKHVKLFEEMFVDQEGQLQDHDGSEDVDGGLVQTPDEVDDEFDVQQYFAMIDDTFHNADYDLKQIFVDEPDMFNEVKREIALEWIEKIKRWANV